MNNQSRRQFLKHSSFALAGAALAGNLGWTSSSAAATARPKSANGRLGVAIVGSGNRGTTLLRECLANAEAWQLDFPAVCDVWSVSRDSAADLVAKATGRRPKTFSSYREMLEMDGIDCVIIATTDFTHTPILVAAADAGKHVYVEKPMAVSVEQANAALDAANRNNTIVQVGTQFRSFPQFAQGAQAVQSGEIGDLVKIECHYLRPAIGWGKRPLDVVHEKDIDWEQFLDYLPSRPFDARRFRAWHLYTDYTTGVLGLLGAHVIDIASWFAGDHLPLSATAVEAWLTNQENETADFQQSIFTYDKKFIVNASVRHGNSAPGSHVAFYGTRGTLHCPYSQKATLSLSPTGASASDPAQPREITAPAAESHMQNWIDCIRAGSRETFATIHAGYAHSVSTALAAQSAREGRRIRFDPQTRTASAG